MQKLLKTADRIASDPKLNPRIRTWGVNIHDKLSDCQQTISVMDLHILDAIVNDRVAGLLLLERHLTVF